jgi:AmmeMemoRadiSam system protein A
MSEQITEHPYVELARQAIETYLQTNQIIKLPTPLPPELDEPSAVFVSLHTAEGLLRGCRGTIAPTERTLAEAIIKTAITAAINDPRFQPMTLAETDGLNIKVDRLSPLELVEDETQLDARVYGVLIESKSGPRRALLLPDIAGIDSVPHQLTIVRQKAGLLADEPATFYRFTVTRYT